MQPHLARSHYTASVLTLQNMLCTVHMIYTACSDRQWLKAIDCICEQSFVSAKWIYVGFVETLVWKAFCDKGRTEIVWVGQQHEERFMFMMMSVSDLATTNIYSADPRHTTWKAYVSTFTLHIPDMLQGKPTFQHLPCRFLSCYMDSLQFNIYSAYSSHANGRSTFQHLLYIFPPCYMESLHFNIYSADSRHATRTAYVSTFTLQIHAMLHGQNTFQH